MGLGAPHNRTFCYGRDCGWKRIRSGTILQGLSTVLLLCLHWRVGALCRQKRNLKLPWARSRLSWPMEIVRRLSR